MKVAILGPAHPWRGGIAHHTASLYRALDDAGHDVCLYNFSRLYPEIFFPGRSQLDPSAHAFSVPSQQIFDPIDPRTWLRMAQALYETRPARLLMQWWHPFFAPGYAVVAGAARALGCKVVMHCHNVTPHESTPVDFVLLQLAYAFPTRFIVQSQAEARRLEELLPRTPPIDVVAHPRYDIFVDNSPARSATATEPESALNPRNARHSLLFFGLVRPYKGLDLLLEALARLPDTLDFELRVVGEIYGDAEPYHRQIAELGLGGRVHLDDRYIPNEEVPAVFTAADVCILPYRHATGSGVANLALACGVPLVMSDLQTLRESFADAHVHWFEPENTSSMVAAILGALREDTPHAQRSSRAEVVGRDAQGGWQQLVDAIVATR